MCLCVCRGTGEAQAPQAASGCWLWSVAQLALGMSRVKESAFHAGELGGGPGEMAHIFLCDKGACGLCVYRLQDV